VRAVLSFEVPGAGGGSCILSGDVENCEAMILGLASHVPKVASWSCRPLDATEDERVAILGGKPESMTHEQPVGRQNMSDENENQDLYKRLSEEFPKELLGTLTKGGSRLTYAPIAEVVTRLNEVIGVGNWSSHVVKVWRDETDTDWILAVVRLEAKMPDGSVIHKEQAGGQKIKRVQTSKDPIDLGDEYKGAVSDALKKCCQQLGIALELARKEEALRWAEERDMEAENAPIAPELAQKLKDDIASLMPKAQEKLKAWWTENSLPKAENIPVRLYDDVRNGVDLFLKKQAEYEAKQAEQKKGDNDPPDEGGEGGARVPANPHPPTSPPAQAAVAPPSDEPLDEDQALAAVGAAFPGAVYAPGEEPFD
jgi:hypothetical protein